MRGPARNVALYPWYVASLNCWFWFPVFLLYFTKRVGLEQALLLESVYYAAVVVCEVPSGWASDRFGRRAALRMAMLLLSAAYATFFFAGDFAAFAVAQILLAAGYAFNSGTDTAFHYDSLAADGREDEYSDREERIARWSFGVMAASALVGGLLGAVQLRFAYGAAFVVALAGFGVTLAFARPESTDAPVADRIDRQIVRCVKYLRDPTLAWLFGFAVLMTVLVHVPYQLYQPYLQLLDLRRVVDVPTPLWSGVHAFAAMLAAAWASGRAVQWSRRVGLRPLLLGALAGMVAMIAIIGVALSPIIAVLLIARSVPRGLAVAPLNAAITPRLPRELRASYPSIQSLAGRLGFSVLVASLATEAHSQQPSWADITHMAYVATAVGLVGLVVLALSARRFEL